jgi:predicted RNase H-like nuclease (RuvC/YqgF family)
MIVEILEGLTRDDLTRQVSEQRRELRDYAQTVARLRIRNEHLEKQNQSLMLEIEQLKKPSGYAHAENQGII